MYRLFTDEEHEKEAESTSGSDRSRAVNSKEDRVIRELDELLARISQ